MLDLTTAIHEASRESSRSTETQLQTEVNRFYNEQQTLLNQCAALRTELDDFRQQNEQLKSEKEHAENEAKKLQVSLYACRNRNTFLVIRNAGLSRMLDQKESKETYSDVSEPEQCSCRGTCNCEEVLITVVTRKTPSKKARWGKLLNVIHIKMQFKI